MLILAWLALVAAAAWPQPVGVSYFAMQGYTSKECNTALRVFRGVKIPATAVLWKSFDTHAICLQRFIKRFKDKPHIVEIHFSNEAGRRNRRLGSYEFLPTLSYQQYDAALRAHDPETLDAIRSNTDDINKFIDTHGNINSSFILSTGLEDDLSDAGWRVLAATIRNQLPARHLLTRAPLRNYEQDSDTNDIANAIELHGDQTSWLNRERSNYCIANLDGTDINFSSEGSFSGLGTTILVATVPYWIWFQQFNNCLTFVWWSGPQNSRGFFTEPRRRTYRISTKDVNLINRLIRKKHYAN